MGAAVGELRRDDPKRAAASGERAVDELRRLEQQLRGGQQGAGERAAGELQVEAEQIAQEQRRIAAEAERMDRDTGTPSVEGRRRLAGEKERLAARVEELQRSAGQLGRQKEHGDAAARAGAASRELENGRVAERMRSTARALRDGGRGRAGEQQDPRGARAPAAAAEQQIARALESVAGTLEGAASADARNASAGLDEARAIRDRIDALERQIHDQEARRGEGAQPGQQGPQGRQGARGGSGDGRAGGDLQRLRDDYQRELERARQALGRMLDAERSRETGMATPEAEQFSQSAPGTERFKQDRSGWESLRKDVERSLERYEASMAGRIARSSGQQRLNGGGSERVPDAYQQWIARYFESLARVKK
jgi:hypothetical protein